MGQKLTVSLVLPDQSGLRGVKVAASPAARREDFKVRQDGTLVAISGFEMEAPDVCDEGYGEYFVAVGWTKAMEVQAAVRGYSFFGNQNTVTWLCSSRWDFTVQRLKSRWWVK